MPASIPYDPSLTLTSVVNEKALKNVEEIAKAQGPVNAAEDALNSLIASRRSLDMTKTELKNLGVNTTSLEDELTKLNDQIEKSASAYATAKIAAEPQIQALREQIRSVHSQIESPVDYTKTELKNMPLAADSMNMDCQYFNFDSNSQDADSYSAQIAAYVSRSSGLLGNNASRSLAVSASKQVSDQTSAHNIDGTLVVSVTCTHKNVTVLAPFVLQVDKAIKVWNDIFPGQKLDPTNQSAMMKIAMTDSQEDKQKFSIISGTTFGSSFVGMVHVLNSTNTSVGETLSAASLSIAASMNAGGYIAKKEGKVGVDAKFGQDVKNLLSQQNVTSHVTLLTMGVIPSMVANEVKATVQEFTAEAFNPASNMKQVGAIQAAVESDKATVESEADAARTGGQAADLQSKAVEASLSTLAKIDEANNKMLDINSMMTALENYLNKASTGDCGIPINYWLKDIDIKMLAQMWAAKYFPGKYMAIKYDDSEGAGPAADAGGDQPKAKL